MILEIIFAILFFIFGPFVLKYFHSEWKPEPDSIKKFFKWLLVAICNGFIGFMVGGGLELFWKWLMSEFGG
jgi:hypothetical protein